MPEQSHTRAALHSRVKQSMHMRVFFSQQSVHFRRIISAADRTCVVDTEYDPLKQHSHKLHVSNTKKTGARQAADHMIDPTNTLHR
jgi:hypothetical protein